MMICIATLIASIAVQKRNHLHKLCCICAISSDMWLLWFVSAQES